MIENGKFQSEDLSTSALHLNAKNIKFDTSALAGSQMKSKLALETSAMDPLDPSFRSGKISARSTCLGPSGDLSNIYVGL